MGHSASELPAAALAAAPRPRRRPVVVDQIETRRETLDRRWDPGPGAGEEARTSDIQLGRPSRLSVMTPCSEARA
jgi:hypothetical protein